MPAPSPAARRPVAVIAGFGIPGRAALQTLAARGYECVVIELNPTTVQRMGNVQSVFIQGDATSEEVLRRAGVDRAALIVVAVPADPAALEITRCARALNPDARIVTRCQFTSAGMEARHLGANEVVVAEQAVAVALTQQLESLD